MKKVLPTLGCILLSACGGVVQTYTVGPTETLVLGETSSNTNIAPQGQDSTAGTPTISVADPSAVDGLGGETLSTHNDVSFAKILNNLRVGNRLQPVTYDARLNQAAQAHAQDMVDHDYFSHTSRDGRKVYDRIVATGYDPQAWGENIAGGQQNEEAVLQAWIDSPLHNDVLNANNLEEFALGVAGSGSDLRWVLLMATER